MSKAIKIFPPPLQIIVEGFDFWPISSWFRKRQKRIESIDRQMKLRQFWFDEQIRVRPNMKFLLSGASFEKIDFFDSRVKWTLVEQLTAQAERGILSVIPSDRLIFKSDDGMIYDMGTIRWDVSIGHLHSFKETAKNVRKSCEANIYALNL